MNVLYICTHNHCRSILFEAITNHFTDGRLQAFSAGSEPSGIVHPLVLQLLDEAGIGTSGLYSKSFEVMVNHSYDFVITVCDHAAGQPCPVWLGEVLMLHWGLCDPAAHQGTPAERHAAFAMTMSTVTARVKRLLMLEFDTLNHKDLRRQLLQIVEEEDNGHF